MSHTDVTIRATTPSDLGTFSGLMTLGSRPYVSGRGLVAVLDGDAVAAISLTSGAVVADPDRANSRLVHALRRRRYEILRQGGDLARSVNLLRRLAPAGA